MSAYSVLFVCTANINRSPMAAALFRAQLDSQAAQWKIASAGTWARAGLPAAPNVHVVMKQRQIDVRAHRSQPITRPLLNEHQLILVMARGHKEALQAEFPTVARRIYLLSEMVGFELDVADPLGGPLVDFEDTAAEIERYLRDGFERICDLARSPGT